MVKYLLLFLSLLSLAKASDAQTNCRSECVVSGKSHICQWETVCDPVTPEPTPEPTPTPTPEPMPTSTPSQNLLNSTSPLSILNPNSPLNSPPTVTQTPQTNMAGNDVPTQESSAPQPTAQTDAEKTSEGKILIPGLGLALSLELIVKVMPPQPNLFPDQHIGQEMPNDYKYQMHDLYDVGDPNTFSRLTKDAVELEQ